MSPQDEMWELLDSMSGLSKARRESIMDMFEKHLPGEVRAVYPSGARGAVVETVEAYGLIIDVTANGTAQRVGLAEFPTTSETLDVEYWPS